MIETGADPERAIREADKEAKEENNVLQVSEAVRKMARAARSTTLRSIINAHNRTQQQ